MKLKNKTALITGAGSGIGRAMALSLASRGCHLALVDIQSDGLKETYESINNKDIRISIHIMDVRDEIAVIALKQEIIAVHGELHLLINNAGVAAGGTFDRMSKETFEWVMDINFHSLVNITRQFLPLLKNQSEARIVNMSSLFGLIAPAEQTAYSASKYAVRGFSMALKHELEGGPVGVTVVHPGGVATQIAKNARIPEDTTPEEVASRQELMQRLLRMNPQKAGEIIVRGIEKNNSRILVGIDARLLSLIERLLPLHYWPLLKYLAALRSTSQK